MSRYGAYFVKKFYEPKRFLLTASRRATFSPRACKGERMRVYLSVLIGFLAASPAFAGKAANNIESQPYRTQMLVFGQLIRSAGRPCGSASRSLYLGDSRTLNEGFWTVRCESGDYLVIISNKGDMDTKVVPCKIAIARGAGCWKVH